MSEEPMDPVDLSAEEAEAAKSSLRYVWRAVLAVAILASLAFAVMTQVSNLPDIEWHFQPGWLVLAILGFTVLEWTHAEIWRLILNSLHGHIDPARSRAIWCTSLLAKYVPTSALLIVTRINFAAHAGVPKRVTAASLVYEVPITIAGTLILGSYYVVELPQLEEHALRWAVFAIPVVFLLVLHPRVFHPVADWALRRVKREPLPETLSFGRVLAMTGLYMLSFILAGLATYAFVRSLHVIEPDEIPLVIASFSIGLAMSFFGFLLPAGLGAREAGFAAALALAVPTAVAVAVAIGVRLLQVGIEVGYAIVTPVLARRAEARTT